MKGMAPFRDSLWPRFGEMSNASDGVAWMEKKNPR